MVQFLVVSGKIPRNFLVLLFFELFSLEGAGDDGQGADSPSAIGKGTYGRRGVIVLKGGKAVLAIFGLVGSRQRTGWYVLYVVASVPRRHLFAHRTAVLIVPFSLCNAEKQERK